MASRCYHIRRYGPDKLILEVRPLEVKHNQDLWMTDEEARGLRDEIDALIVAREHEQQAAH
jgi:hypothetical protein